jgi:hypothetical protein
MAVHEQAILSLPSLFTNLFCYAMQMMMVEGEAEALPLKLKELVNDVLVKATASQALYHDHDSDWDTPDHESEAVQVCAPVQTRTTMAREGCATADLFCHRRMW